MRQENGACRSVLKDVARGPAQKHLAQAAMGIGAHDQQAGFMLCPRREQRIAHRAQFRGNHLRGRTDAMTAQIGKHAPMLAQELKDPTSKYPKPPYKKQSQSWPGLASKMEPRPDHGQKSYTRS